MENPAIENPKTLSYPAKYNIICICIMQGGWFMGKTKSSLDLGLKLRGGR
jgi:hypothetical protein